MKKSISLGLIYNLPSLACIIGAILGMLYEGSSWGWFLVVAALICSRGERNDSLEGDK